MPILKRNKRDQEKLEREAKAFAKTTFAEYIANGMTPAQASKATIKDTREKFGSDWLSMLKMIMELITMLKELFNK